MPGRRALLRAGVAAAVLPLVAAPGRADPAARSVRAERWRRHTMVARAAGAGRRTGACGSIRVLWSGCPQTPAVALTFDDGPSAEWTAGVLDALAAAGARATFYAVGQQVRRYPDLVRRQRDEGHEHGNHTDTHADLAALDEEEGLTELLRCHESLDALGCAPRTVRPPFGHVSGTAMAALGRYGRDVALWSASFEERGHDVAGNVARVRATLQAGGVLLGHDEGDGRRGVGLAALPGVLRDLRERGLEPVTMTELLAGAARPST